MSVTIKIGSWRKHENNIIAAASRPCSVVSKETTFCYKLFHNIHNCASSLMIGVVTQILVSVMYNPWQKSIVLRTDKVTLNYPYDFKFLSEYRI